MAAVSPEQPEPMMMTLRILSGIGIGLILRRDEKMQ